MRIFLSGVAGTAMGGLALLLCDLGHEVVGSDTAFYPPIGPMLRSSGVRLLEGYRAENLDAVAPDLHIVGNVCRRDNPEVVRGAELGLPRLHIAEALRRFVLARTSPLVVAGTHGKTTTSSLVLHLLDAAGLRPGFLIGGIPRGQDRGSRLAGPQSLGLLKEDPLVHTENSNLEGSRHSSRLGLGSPLEAGAERANGERRVPFVLEGDEYDTAFWEKTAKFLHYGAEVAILTSIEHDHVDIYPTLQSYEAAFEQFVQTLPSSGLLVASAADPTVRRVAQGAPCQVLYYGVAGDDFGDAAPHFYAELATENENGLSFDLFAGGVLVGRHLTRLPGRHNLRNALAALGAAAAGYGAKLSSMKQALATFEGVKRRQELRGAPRGIRVYDDFAHHPTAVLETLRALRAKHPSGALFAVFEPRSATACRRMHQDDYPSAFAPATHVLLAPVGRSELPQGERLSVETVVSDIRARGGLADGPLEVQEIVERLRELTRPGDTIAVLSNGSFGGIFEALLAALAHGIEAPSEGKPQ